MKTILITGGSGMIGRRLSEILFEKGYNVIWLSRERDLNAEIPQYRWNYQKNEIDKEALEKANVIIHLAGSNLGEGMWTPRKQQNIVDSRVQTTKLLLGTVMMMSKRPEAFISASAVGYYGMHTSNKIYSEEDQPAQNDFLSTTCKEWENAANHFQEDLGIRTVILRTAFVISSENEGFEKMKTLTRFGLGAPLGTGNQYMSWIQLEDLCNLYVKAVENSHMRGVYNAVAPQQVTNAQFMKALAKETHRPFIFPKIPAFMIRFFLREAAGMILEGSRVSAQKILTDGYQFCYPTVNEAIRESL